MPRSLALHVERPASRFVAQSEPGVPAVALEVPVTYVLLTYVGQRGVDEWHAMSPAEKEAYVGQHQRWFGRHGARVRGGEELGHPGGAHTVLRQGGRTIVTDGPYVESKELLGGFIVVEADPLDEATEMARDWPSLGTDGNRVEVWPVGSSEAEVVAAQRSP